VRIHEVKYRGSRDNAITLHAYFALRPTCESKEVIHSLVRARFPLSWMATARFARASRFYFRRQQRDLCISRTIITYPSDGKFPFSRKRRTRRGIAAIDSQIEFRCANGESRRSLISLGTIRCESNSESSRCANLLLFARQEEEEKGGLKGNHERAAYSRRGSCAEK